MSLFHWLIEEDFDTIRLIAATYKFLASNFRNSLRFYCRFTGPTIPKVRGLREKNLYLSVCNSRWPKLFPLNQTLLVALIPTIFLRYQIVNVDERFVVIWTTHQDYLSSEKFWKCPVLVFVWKLHKVAKNCTKLEKLHRLNIMSQWFSSCKVLTTKVFIYSLPSNI